jgi:hypothetical protein
MDEQDTKYNKIQIAVQNLINVAATDYFNTVKNAVGLDRIKQIKAAGKVFRNEILKSLAWGMEQVAALEEAKPVTINMMKYYHIGKTTLSSTLYTNSAQVEINAVNTIRNHIKYFHDVRKLTLELYEGYDFKPITEEVLQIKIPRLPIYMSDAVLARDINSLMHDIASKQASGLKSDMLRATYLKILDDIENGRGDKVLQKAIKVAIEEKSRYYASRIAKTELHRTRIKQLARQYVADNDVQYVQVELSGSHPKVDMCDIFAKQNRYGVGPGVYPTNLCPAPPFHPHCRCSLTPRWDLYGATEGKENKHAATDLIKDVGYEEGLQMASTEAGLQLIKKGMDYHALFDSRVKYSEYKLKTILDFSQER